MRFVNSALGIRSAESPTAGRSIEVFVTLPRRTIRSYPAFWAEKWYQCVTARPLYSPMALFAAPGSPSTRYWHATTNRSVQPANSDGRTASTCLRFPILGIQFPLKRRILGQGWTWLEFGRATYLGHQLSHCLAALHSSFFGFNLEAGFVGFRFDVIFFGFGFDVAFVGFRFRGT